MERPEASRATFVAAEDEEDAEEFDMKIKCRSDDAQGGYESYVAWFAPLLLPRRARFGRSDSELPKPGLPKAGPGPQNAPQCRPHGATGLVALFLITQPL